MGRLVFVEEDGRPGNLAGFVVEVGDHVQEKAAAIARECVVAIEVFFAVFEMCVNGCAAVTEEGFVNFGTVHGKGAMFGTVGAQSAAVFVHVFIARWLVVIPYPAIARVFLVYGEGHVFSFRSLWMKKEREKETRVKFLDKVWFHGFIEK